VSGPRLLLVVRGSEHGGVATKLSALVRALGRRGWVVTACVLGEGPFDAGAAEVVRGTAAPPHYRPQRGGRMRAALRVAAGSGGVVRRVRRMARAFDAVLWSEHGLVLPMAAALAGTGRPGFWLMPNAVGDGYPFDLNRRLYAAAFRLGGVTAVANSRFTLATLGRAGRGSAAIELGVEPEPLLAAGGPDPMAHLPAGAVRLLVMARLVPNKGLLPLAQALTLPGLEDVHLVACGGPVAGDFPAAVRATGLGARLHLVGPVADGPLWYAHADLVANMRIDPEPFGLSIAEAMLAGRPVIAHAAGGPAEIVVDGETGWLIGGTDPATIAAGLRRALGERARWPEMGAAGRARALERYTADGMAGRLLAVMAANGVAKAQDMAGAGAGGSSGSGMNSASSASGSFIRPAFQSAAASASRACDEDTKFQ